MKIVTYDGFFMFFFEFFPQLCCSQTSKSHKALSQIIVSNIGNTWKSLLKFVSDSYVENTIYLDMPGNAWKGK